jgi:mono/diheme cytochrome c family protein
MLRVSWFVGLLLSFSLVMTACGDGEETAAAAADAPTNTPAAQAAVPASVPQGDAENGKQLFLTSCSACHGPEGKGVQGLGKDMTGSEFIAGLSDDDLLAFIKAGRSVGDPLNTTGVTMPPKGGNPALTDEQIRDIVAYMRSIHQ